jgi:hypothetical protein
VGGIGWGTHLIFFVLRFLAFVVVPSLIPASSSSSGTSLPFFAFLVLGFFTCSSAFDGPRFRVFETAGGVTVVVSLARRLVDGIVRGDGGSRGRGCGSRGRWYAVVGGGSGKQEVTWQRTTCHGQDVTWPHPDLRGRGPTSRTYIY